MYLSCDRDPIDSFTDLPTKPTSQGEVGAKFDFDVPAACAIQNEDQKARKRPS